MSVLEDGGVPHTDAVIEIDRYIAEPAQALAYTIGMIEIERAREGGAADPGFDLPRFHDRVLELGQLPLPAFRREMGLEATEQGRLGRVHDSTEGGSACRSTSGSARRSLVGVIAIPAGGEIKAEAGAMTSMSGGVEIETKAQGGVMAGLKRSVLGGESFFINTFTRDRRAASSPSPRPCPATSCTCRSTPPTPMMVQSGSWLASETGVEVDTKWGGAKTFFCGEGLFLLRCTGAGDMLVSSYGAIEQRQPAPASR